MNRITSIAALVGALLCCAALLGVESWARWNSDLALYGATLVQAALALGAARIAMANPGRATMALVFGGAIALRLGALVQIPLLSIDAYRYVWDGRLVLNGFNPYLHVPADPALAYLRDRAIYPLVNQKELAVANYPPVAVGLFALIDLAGQGVTMMRVAMLGFEALAVAGLLSLMKRLDVRREWILAYLWHPAPIWEFANNGHVDAAMLGLLVAGVAWGEAAGRPYRGGLSMALGALTKPYGALWFPAVWRPFDWRLPAFVLAVAALSYAPVLLGGGGVLGFLPGYVHQLRLDSGRGFLFPYLALKFGAPAWINAAFLAGVVGLLAAAIAFMLSRRDRDLRTRIGEAGTLSIGLLFLLTPVFPWYFALAYPFFVLCGSWTAFAMMTTGFWLYNFNFDRPEFHLRWAAMTAVIAVGAVVDVARALRARPAPQPSLSL
ncbi:MAG: hypothetical protein KGI57_01355 [Hyphomicrobiales bacterium]|nr:hypothetical protein [Hyphomicrobiales bacterium]MDE2016332.1 hypothetical protein [Hyphomicrobiales bacterium]